MYCDNSPAASRPTTRHWASVRGTSRMTSAGGTSTGREDGPMRPGWGGTAPRGGRVHPMQTTSANNDITRTRPSGREREPANYRPPPESSTHGDARLTGLPYPPPLPQRHAAPPPPPD